jgi:hexosaminidase
VNSMYQRMAVVSRDLEWTGVRHRSNYMPMLERIAGGRDVGALKVLADASEALGLGPRKSSRYTTLTPLNRFVDAVPPESESVRELETLARRAVASRAPADLAALRTQFALWAANDAQFRAIADRNAMLAELQQLSRDLSQLGAMGSRAAAYLSNGRPAPAQWLAAQQREIARIQKPDAEVTLAAFRPVKLLLDALTRK